MILNSRWSAGIALYRRRSHRFRRCEYCENVRPNRGRNSVLPAACWRVISLAMWPPRLSTATHDLWRFLVDRARDFQARSAQNRVLRASKCSPEERGIKLLREWLSHEQCAQFDAERYFDVTGCHSQKKYRIRYGSSANMDELDDADVPRMGWCFVPNIYLVAGDVMLAQKIVLETNERDALAVANRLPRDFRQMPPSRPSRSRGF